MRVHIYIYVYIYIYIHNGLVPAYGFDEGVYGQSRY